MKVIEKFLCGKENNFDTCEDGIYISDKLIAVIDGVTAKSESLYDGKKSGFYAKEVLLEYLQQGVEQQNVYELLNHLNAILRDSVGLRENRLLLEEYPRASVIIYNDFYKEIWAYGDCQCSINGKVHAHVKRVDELNAALRAYAIEYYLLNGTQLEELKKNDLGRKYIQKNLQQQFVFENKEGYFGYPVLNGMGIEDSLVNIYKVSPGDEVILASDGYPRLKSNLRDSEEELMKILQEDPMCFWKFRSTKGVKEGNVSFDDRAFCRFVVA